MSKRNPAEPPERPEPLDEDLPAEMFHRDRREHGGSPRRVDDDKLARLTEEERVEAGVDDFDPDEVPPAADEPVPTDITDTEQFQEERAEFRRELDHDEIVVKGQRDPFPPSHYDE
jgi:hypothetical protein